MTNVPEKHRAVAHAWIDGATIERRRPGTDHWCGVDFPCWNDQLEYRIALTKPSIDWGHVAPEWNYLARDDVRGFYFFYRSKPHLHLRTAQFVDGNGSTIVSRAFASFDPGTCDWKESLVCRPGFEGENG